MAAPAPRGHRATPTRSVAISTSGWRRRTHPCADAHDGSRRAESATSTVPPSDHQETAMNNTSTVLDRIGSVGFETNRRGRRVSVTGAAYVAAWVTGLVLAPATPAATASAERVHDYYAT